MPRFLNTRKAVSEIEDLIRNAGERLTLISPYLKISNDFKELLKYRNNKDKATTIVFGKQELSPDELNFLQSLRLVVLRFNENLHAKCYLNDDRIIITSLNLYEFSMANNKEMGIMLEKGNEADEKAIDEALKEVEYIISTSQLFDFSPTMVKKSPSKPVKPGSVTISAIGFCIRTGVKIPFNIEKPMSYEAYKIWSQYGDPDYPEKFCHFSGEPSNGETSVSKPILGKNWKKAKEMYGLWMEIANQKFADAQT